MESQRGYSLIETLVASAIAFVAGSLLVWLVRATVFQAAHLDARLDARSSTDRLADRLAADAASAWSVFAPNANEIDFMSEDASHRVYWWAYRYDATAQRVTVYANGTGSPPAAGDVFESIAGFDARTYPVTDVTNGASAIFDPLFVSASATPVDVDFGWGVGATGGNHLVRVAITATGIDRTMLLASSAAPTHFTVIVDYTPPPATPTP